MKIRQQLTRHVRTVCRPLTLKVRWTMQFRGFLHRFAFPYFITRFLTDFFICNTQISTENIYRKTSWPFKYGIYLNIVRCMHTYESIQNTNKKFFFAKQEQKEQKSIGSFCWSWLSVYCSTVSGAVADDWKGMCHERAGRDRETWNRTLIDRYYESPIFLQWLIPLALAAPRLSNSEYCMVKITENCFPLGMLWCTSPHSSLPSLSPRWRPSRPRKTFPTSPGPAETPPRWHSPRYNYEYRPAPTGVHSVIWRPFWPGQAKQRLRSGGTVPGININQDQPQW